MTQQNTTEKSHSQNRYSGAGQDNRPHKKRRRRKPAVVESAAGTSSAQVKADGTDTAVRPDFTQNTTEIQNAASQTETAPNIAPSMKSVQSTVSQAEAAQDTILQTETAQSTVPQPETAQTTASQPETAQTTASQPETAQTAASPEDQPMENPAAASETTVAESIDYQAAYQEIYRDILENLRSFSPSDQVACSITEEHISEYLNNSHAEKVMQFKERREKRFFTALELIAVLAAVVLVIHYLQNNSAILVNILYIIAGLGALFLWKFQPQNDDRPDSGSDKEAR